MTVVLMKDGEVLKVGDRVEDFRGAKRWIKGIFPPGTQSGGQGGRVCLADHPDATFCPLFFVSVIRADWRELGDNGQTTGEAQDPLEAPKSSPRFRRAMAEEKGYGD
jgi:hypothetical protein